MVLGNRKVYAVFGKIFQSYLSNRVSAIKIISRPKMDNSTPLLDLFFLTLWCQLHTTSLTFNFSLNLRDTPIHIYQTNMHTFFQIIVLYCINIKLKKLQHSAHISGGLSSTELAVVVDCPLNMPDIQSKNGLRSLPFPIKLVDVAFVFVTNEFSAGNALVNRKSATAPSANGCNICIYYFIYTHQCVSYIFHKKKKDRQNLCEIRDTLIHI